MSVWCCHSFFEDYKKNENKMVRVDDILGAAEAVKAVKDGLVSEGCAVLCCAVLGTADRVLQAMLIEYSYGMLSY